MLHAIGSESENKKPDTGASTAALLQPHASFDFDGGVNHGSDHLAEGQPLAATQAAGGNQASLKRLPFSFMPGLSNQSRLQMLERKQDCACGGQCAECGGKAGARPNFIGDVDDGIPRQLPDEGTPATPVKEGDAAKKAPSCKDICDRAYNDASLNHSGGGVICDGATKCACVFDVLSIKRGQCPSFDKNVVEKHETAHLVDVDCDSTKGLHRPPFRDPSKATESECAHRKETIKDIDALLPKSAGICKKGMKELRGVLDTWIKANCP